MNISAERKLLLHYLASIAYHLQKAIRDAPNNFWIFSAGNKTRTPFEILIHITSLIGYTRCFFIGGTYTPEALPGAKEELERFHIILEEVAKYLNDNSYSCKISEYQLLQGPLSDIMTHIGQLSMLRRLYGDPVPPENFIYANITSNNLTMNQSLPAAPDKVWPEANLTKS